MDPNTVIRQIQNRNHFVFKKLFEDFYKELVRYAHGYLYDTSSSEDVVQEVFVQLWERPNDIKIESSLKSYLYFMVRNRCLNVLRSVKITDSASILELRTTIADTEPDFSSSLTDDRDKACQEVLRIVDALPAKMRDVVKLRFISNYRYSEIAEELGISVNTVKTQLKRAKMKFGELTLCIITIFSLLK